MGRSSCVLTSSAVCRIALQLGISSVYLEKTPYYRARRRWFAAHSPGMEPIQLLKVAIGCGGADRNNSSIHEGEDEVRRVQPLA
jgi:hypothetical protein